MIAPEEASAPDPASRGAAGSGAAAWVAVPLGWGVAAAVLVPPLASSDPGARGAPLLVLAAVLAWWGAVVMVVRSDLRDFVIPDGASLLIAGLGLAVAGGAPWLAGEGPDEAALAGLAALATGVAAFTVFALVGALFRRFGREALGFGDVKLAGASAVWLAPADAALALEIAALGAVLALLATRRGGSLRDTAVPFGAFMAPAAWLVFVLAPPLRAAPGLLPW